MMDKEKRRFFTQTKPENPTGSTTPQQGASAVYAVGKVFLTVIALAILVYVGFSLFLFSRHIAESWQEIIFAYNKPALVRTVRIQYDQKQTALDQQFLNSKTADQKLLDSVKQTVDTEVQAAQQKQTNQSFR